MFWNLFLAHLLGDFVFQMDWMVKKRGSLWVQSLHVLIHFVTMFILAGRLRFAIWPYLLLIATWHFFQDRIKYNFTEKRPVWISWSFIIDQGVHVFIIWVVIGLFQMITGSVIVTEKPPWVMVTLAFVFVTFVWFIIERIFNFSNPEYLQNITTTRFTRMLSRAGMVSVFLLFWHWTAAGLSFLVSNPYPQSKFRQRAVLTDVSVSLFAIFFLYWALR